ncbi:kinase-like protein [Delitschia confertaspora ATCC 74209]|uniref:Kinase-like protein n=1 Tax=Delitschia confertaspora ATCC 74209 TaxID=1513339 RepID=A0A9P4JR08_9PLEO|nr:kinase-like protein [Delitschia confertaspora ATCC 74209]
MVEDLKLDSWRLLHGTLHHSQTLQDQQAHGSEPSPDSDEIAKEIGEAYGWQVGQKKFVPDGSPRTMLVRTDRPKLGKGSVGEVDEVRCVGNVICTLARKRVAIYPQRRRAMRQLNLIRNEITNTKRLRHPHIVEVVGSYQDGSGNRRHFNVLMHPVGDNDLSVFLEIECKCIQEDIISEKSKMYRAWIRLWFKCLSSALAYMHSQRIHHEGIKPRNIIHRGDKVFFLQILALPEDLKSVRTHRRAILRRPVAYLQRLRHFPTADGKLERHGSKTDVFSLGLVFVEMLTVINASDIDSLQGFPEGHNEFGDTWEYHRVVDLFAPWFQSLEGNAYSLTSFSVWQDYIEPIIRYKRQERPSVVQVARNLRGAWLGVISPGCECEKVMLNALTEYEMDKYH